MAKTGRPSKYTKEIGEKICELLSTTSQSLKTICKSSKMPSTVTIYAWLDMDEHKDFLNMYTRAREEQGHLLAEEIIEIADNDSEDEIKDSEGRVRFNTEFAARSKIKIDARKWLASKLAPKKFGDKIQTEHSGDVGIIWTETKSYDEANKKTD